MASLILALTLNACAKDYRPSECDALDPELYIETEDKFENYNRAMFEFNLKVDRLLFERTAKAYRKYTNDEVEKSVSSFFRNLKEPRNILASLLAADFETAAASTMRFTFNSTFGMLGLFDVSGMGGIEYENYDFGRTMGRWGIGSGPYIVLPLIGPASPRSIVGSAVHNKHTYVVKRIEKSETQLLVQQLSLVDTRARLIPFTDLLAEQPDPYIFARESYIQNRLNQVCNP